MNNEIILFFLCICIAVLICIVVYQQFVFRRGIQKQLKEISQKLEKIQDTDSDENIMMFTDEQALMELLVQINRLLENQRKMKVDYRRSQISAKKMLSNISHDIKTPMTVILGYLEIIRINGDKEDEMLLKVEQKAKRVMFQVEVKIPEEAVFIMGNKEALHRILYNLISNVIRYGLDGRYLGLVLRSVKNDVYIDVIDKGKGIGKEFAGNVFERLFTMEDSRNRRIQGNGLGLTIAQTLAQQLGGEIVLESEPNVKTTFTVKLHKCFF